MCFAALTNRLFGHDATDTYDEQLTQIETKVAKSGVELELIKRRVRVVEIALGAKNEFSGNG